MGAFLGRFAPQPVVSAISSVIPSRESMISVVDSLVAFEQQVVEAARTRLFPSTSESKH